MNLRFFIMRVLVCIGTAFLPSISWGLDYPLNFAFQQVPRPLAEQNPVKPQPARPVPTAGKSFLDSSYGTILTRVTQGIGLRHEYSRFDPFNADQSMILLQQPATGAW